jgi:hypothetical protein
LTSQLYERSTHFLLELIQNADDNLYTCVTPTLRFSYKPGTLRIDCNEVGFTTESVEAICAVNQSTKGRKTVDCGYIGEKGIGFKSVFKAADAVWISSRAFKFKFDKTCPLGIITPLWSEFPEPTEPEWTSIYLQLSDDFDQNTLLHELLDFDASLLVFLRRIKEINIEIDVPDHTGRAQKLSRVDLHKKNSHFTVLHTANEEITYLILSHVIKSLPAEQKRPNWGHTNISLGFPIGKASEEPKIVPQSVYASLPIRNYGLRVRLSDLR